MFTIAEVAAHLDLSERRVIELQGKGVLPKGERGQHDRDECRVAYIRHLRSQAGNKPKPGDLDPSQERARRDRAMAVTAETRNALAQGDVVSVEEVGRQVDEAFTVVRTRFLALPAKVDMRFDRSKPDTLFGILQDEVHDALQELSGPEDLPVVQGAADRQKRNS